MIQNHIQSNRKRKKQAAKISCRILSITDTKAPTFPKRPSKSYKLVFDADHLLVEPQAWFTNKTLQTETTNSKATDNLGHRGSPDASPRQRNRERTINTHGKKMYREREVRRSPTTSSMPGWSAPQKISWSSTTKLPVMMSPSYSTSSHTHSVFWTVRTSACELWRRGRARASRRGQNLRSSIAAENAAKLGAIFERARGDKRLPRRRERRWRRWMNDCGRDDIRRRWGKKSMRLSVFSTLFMVNTLGHSINEQNHTKNFRNNIVDTN